MTSLLLTSSAQMTPALTQTLKYLKVTFDAEIQEREVPLFRGAVAGKVGAEPVLFHNHLPDGSLRHAYPLIQYKRLGKRPSILCFAEGVDQIHHYFSQSNWDLQLGNRHVSMRIDRLNLVNYSMKILESPKAYQIKDWIALNQEDYKEFQKLEGIIAQVQFLESRLWKALSYFAKGVGFPQAEHSLRVIIDDLPYRRVVTLHKQKVSAFDVSFRTNLSIPDYTGVGKGVVVGMGVVSREKVSHKRRQFT